MHPPRLHFNASAAFVARTDFTHDGVKYKAGAPFAPSGVTVHDLHTLWRTALIDVAPAAPPPPKPSKPPRASARS